MSYRGKTGIIFAHMSDAFENIAADFIAENGITYERRPSDKDHDAFRDLIISWFFEEYAYVFESDLLSDLVEIEDVDWEGLCYDTLEHTYETTTQTEGEQS